MSTAKTNRGTRILVGVALALGVMGGSYGLASAAGGSGNSPPAAAGAAPNAQRPWGGQRPDETRQNGDIAARITAAAKAKVPGGTIVRVETDADGNAKYEAHMLDASGNPVTVYVNASFQAVGVESR
jgi:hypothetical protein